MQPIAAQCSRYFLATCEKRPLWMLPLTAFKSHLVSTFRLVELFDSLKRLRISGACTDEPKSLTHDVITFITSTSDDIEQCTFCWWAVRDDSDSEPVHNNVVGPLMPDAETGDGLLTFSLGRRTSDRPEKRFASREVESMASSVTSSSSPTPLTAGGVCYSPGDGWTGGGYGRGSVHGAWLWTTDRFAALAARAKRRGHALHMRRSRCYATGQTNATRRHCPAGERQYVKQSLPRKMRTVGSGR